MRRGPLHSKAAWLCLALYLSLSVGVSGLVLCVGKAGHVAIESRSAGDCCDERRGERDPSRLAATDACECTDASLLQPAAGVRGSALTAATLAAVSEHPRVVAAPPGATPARIANTGRGSPPLPALRTVILLV